MIVLMQTDLPEPVAPAGIPGSALPGPFPVMSYADAMRDYGSDKPDLRVPLKLTELTDAMKSVEFKVFAGPANAPGGRQSTFPLPYRHHLHPEKG